MGYHGFLSAPFSGPFAFPEPVAIYAPSALSQPSYGYAYAGPVPFEVPAACLA
jgi:hypothetical protein